MAEEKKFVSPIEMILDEKNNENIKLYDEKNSCVEFEQIAVIPFEEKVYCILRPIAGVEGIKEDEAVVFCIDEVDDEDCLVVVDDDVLADKVFAQYYEMLKAEGIEV